MSKCLECRFYTPITSKIGRCLWHNIPAEMDAKKCAGGIFRSR